MFQQAGKLKPTTSGCNHSFIPFSALADFSWDIVKKEIIDKIYEISSLKLNEKFCSLLTKEENIIKEILKNDKIKDTYIELFKVILFDKNNSYINEEILLSNDCDKLKDYIKKLQAKNQNSRKQIELLENLLREEKDKVQLYEEKKKRRSQGKKHIRGSQEFYDEILNANELAVIKVNKKGKEYIDYRSVIKYAKESKAIIEYAKKNNLRINRDNIKSWNEVAKSLKFNIKSKVSVGKARDN